MKLPDLQQHILKILIPLWLFLSSMIGFVLQTLLPLDKLKEIENIIWVKIIAILFLTILFGAFYILILHSKLKPKLNMSKYTYNTYGYYIRKSDNVHLCPKCLLSEPHIEAPICVKNTILVCSVCGNNIL